jgi:hypothetical protein
MVDLVPDDYTKVERQPTNQTYVSFCTELFPSGVELSKSFAFVTVFVPCAWGEPSPNLLVHGLLPKSDIARAESATNELCGTALRDVAIW